jgi:hypothetical protein
VNAKIDALSITHPQKKNTQREVLVRGEKAIVERMARIVKRITGEMTILMRLAMTTTRKRRFAVLSY